MRRLQRWCVLIVANVLFCCMLSFYQTGKAAPGPQKAPFANSVQQRGEMIALLKEVKGLLKEQNAVLKSGRLKVIVEASPPQRGR